ncbi:MAG TPA: flagellar basal-body MS-ring/collar protein FliF [Candidatus Sulfotelmatobacter sp.]|nr:flagellar basal-body MS-ring/collar protein FliF [Candidatus Sulfotelmatobacter sp.]
MADTPPAVNDVLLRMKQFFLGLTLNQRLLLAGGAILVGSVLWLFVALLGQTKYVTLYSGLRPEEAQNLASRLATKNIQHQVSSDGGSLLVPEDKLDASRLETAAAGLPRSARMGFELFDTPNWAGSDFTEKVNYQRALEGELERTLSTLNEVESVRVHLVLPQESLFTEQQHDAKAAVIIKTRGGQLSEQAQQAIPQLVASAVDRLRPENVTVVDADSNTPLLRNRNASGGKSYGLDEELSKTLVRTLEPVVGADHVRASVHVEYDLGTSEDTQETYDPKTTATVTQEHSEESSTGAAPAGVPGTASNVPSGTPPAASGIGGEQSSSRSDATTYAVSKSMHHSIEPPGRVRRVAAAVLVDDAVDVIQQGGKSVSTRRKRTAEEMKQIEQLAQAAIGVDTQRGDVLAVENLSFQQAPLENIPVPGRAEHLRHLVQPWTWALRYVGLALLFLVVYWLVLRPVKKQALTAFRELPGRASARLAPQVSGEPAGALAGVAIESGENRANQLKRLLSDKVKAEPEAASRLVQSWVQQEPSR